MSADSHDAVTMCLSTTDGVFVDVFMKGLEEQGLDNAVHHVTSGTGAFEFVTAQAGTKPYLILFDIRAPESGIGKFLSDVARREGNNPAVIIVIADNDDEMSIVANYAHMIAGRISPNDPAADFFQLVERVLSSNWSVETISTPPTDETN